MKIIKHIIATNLSNATIATIGVICPPAGLTLFAVQTVLSIHQVIELGRLIIKS